MQADAKENVIREGTQRDDQGGYQTALMSHEPHFCLWAQLRVGDRGWLLL